MWEGKKRCACKKWTINFARLTLQIIPPFSFDGYHAVSHTISLYREPPTAFYDKENTGILNDFVGVPYEHHHGLECFAVVTVKIKFHLQRGWFGIFLHNLTLPPRNQIFSGYHSLLVTFPHPLGFV